MMKVVEIVRELATRLILFPIVIGDVLINEMIQYWCDYLSETKEFIKEGVWKSELV